MFKIALLPVLRARRRTFLAVWLVTLAIAVVVTLAWPPHYVATAAVVAGVRTSDPIAGIALPGGMLSNHIATQADIVRSERVLLRAIQALKLDTDVEQRALWLAATAGEGDINSWLADELSRKLDVRPARDSSLLTLSVSSTDAAFSARLANAVMQAYIDTSLELRLEPARHYSRFFEEQARPLREAFEQAQARLSQFQRDNGIVASDERLDVDYTRLADLTSQVVTLQSNAAEARNRSRQARLNPARMDEVTKDPVVAALAADLTLQETRLAELSSRLGSAHPQVLAQRDMIGGLRGRLGAEQKRASKSLSATDNVARARLAEQSGRLAAQRERMLQLKTQRDEAMVLQRDVEGAQRAYEAVLARARQTALESQDTQVNVSVMKLATAPTEATWPKKPLNIAVGLLAGLLLALATVLMLEARDRRLRTPHDVALHLQLPLLVQVPRLGSAPARLGQSARVVDGLSQRPRPHAT